MFDFSIGGNVFAKSRYKQRTDEHLAAARQSIGLRKLRIGFVYAEVIAPLYIGF
jgi:hypothetical protein